MTTKSRKPLVNWCRWHNAALRLAGHDEQSVWGELAFEDTRTEAFRFDMFSWQLTRQTEQGSVVECLDEMGIARDGQAS